MACAAIVIAWFAVRYASGTRELRAVQELPEAERRALYERTLDTLTSTCDASTRPTGLNAYCSEQATFIQQFPECDTPCQALAQRLRQGPTR